MSLAPLGKRPRESHLRLGARQLARLQRWMSAAVLDALAAQSAARGSPTPPAAASDRRGALRRQLESTATLRLIGPGGPRGAVDVAVVDVSRDGIALRIAAPLREGQSISLEINPPGGSRRTSWPSLAGALDRAECETPIRILGVVRYCRPEAGSFVIGCSFGAEWAASLASEILPADLPVLRKSA